MNRSMIEVAKTIQSAYDEQYTDKITKWRELGGKYKAENILTLCIFARNIISLKCLSVEQEREVF
jgi:hypothetical protein